MSVWVFIQRQGACCTTNHAMNKLCQVLGSTRRAPKTQSRCPSSWPCTLRKTLSNAHGHGRTTFSHVCLHLGKHTRTLRTIVTRQNPINLDKQRVAKTTRCCERKVRMICVVFQNEGFETKRGSAVWRLDIVGLGNMNASQRRRSVLNQQCARQKPDEKKKATKRKERKKHKEMIKMFKKGTKM